MPFLGVRVGTMNIKGDVSKELVFISYYTKDKNKRNSLKNAINKTSRYKATHAFENTEPDTSPCDKIKKKIRDSTYFIPILTRKSINEQWVNQEIGYAEAIKSKQFILPIVEDQIIKDLKGFINKELGDLFSFQGIENEKRKEAYQFRKCYNRLINYLESLPETATPIKIDYDPRMTSSTTVIVKDNTRFSATIKPSIVTQGQKFRTFVQFTGSLENGFFDNYIQHLDLEFDDWNWDPSTLKSPGPKAYGTLTGKYRDYTSNWTCDTSKYPPGKYRIYVRVYDDKIKNERKQRIIIKEKIIDIKIV